MQASASELLLEPQSRAFQLRRPSQKSFHFVYLFLKDSRALHKGRGACAKVWEYIVWKQQQRKKERNGIQHQLGVAKLLWTWQTGKTEKNKM